jgi:hypothetical protein
MGVINTMKIVINVSWLPSFVVNTNCFRNQYDLKRIDYEKKIVLITIIPVLITIMNRLNIKNVELNEGIINCQRMTTNCPRILATFVFGLLGLGNLRDVFF